MKQQPACVFGVAIAGNWAYNMERRGEILAEFFEFAVPGEEIGQRFNSAPPSQIPVVWLREDGQRELVEVSIPLGSSVGASHGGSGLIRIYHGREGSIDFLYRNIEQPQWDLLLAFIHETTERFLPSPSSEMQGNFFDAPPPEDIEPPTHGRKTPTAPAV